MFLLYIVPYFCAQQPPSENLPFLVKVPVFTAPYNACKRYGCQPAMLTNENCPYLVEQLQKSGVRRAAVCGYDGILSRSIIDDTSTLAHFKGRAGYIFCEKTAPTYPTRFQNDEEYWPVNKPKTEFDENVIDSTSSQNDEDPWPVNKPKTRYKERVIDSTCNII